MTCMPTQCEANRGGSSLPSIEWPGVMPEQVRHRQAAVLYLQVAAMTDDVDVREHLRRRAAQLITAAPELRRSRLDS